MKWYLTQSLLSSWRFYMNADDAFSESAYASFMASLRCEAKEKTAAMQAGIDFEDAINRTVAGETPEPVNAKWDKAVRRFSKICTGGQPQVPVRGELHVCGMDFGVYGLCDYVKSGVIYDIKKVTRYEYGKYFDSPQHPMYMTLVPEAKKFSYLIFDGSNCYIETYRRGDFKPIEETITEFLRWLYETKNLETYKEYWKMTDERMNKVYGI